MNSMGRIAKHAGILMFVEIGIRLMDAVVAIILARYLAPQSFGLMAFAVSFAALFSIFPGFGMGSLVMRDISREPEKLSRYLGAGLTAKVFLALATLALMAGVAAVLGYSRSKLLLVLIAGLLMIFETNVRFILSFFQAVQQMTAVAFVTLGVRAGWIAAAGAVIVGHGGILEFLAARAAVNAVGLAVALFLVNQRLQKNRWNWDFDFVPKLIKSSVPFTFFRLFGSIYTDIDTVMLSQMRGDIMTGWYAAAQKFSKLFTFIPSGFFGALLPAFSQDAGGSDGGWPPGHPALHDRRGAGLSELTRHLTLACKYLLILALPIAGGISVVADQVTPLVYGPAYHEAAPALRILIWAIPFTFLNQILIAAVAAVNLEKQGSFCLATGALFSALSNLIVIPLFGYLGAASTTLMAELLVSVLQIRILKRELPDFHFLRMGAAKPFACMLFMAAYGWFVRPSGLITVILASGFSYLAGLVISKAVSPEEWADLKNAWREKAGQRA